MEVWNIQHPVSYRQLNNLKSLYNCDFIVAKVKTSFLQKKAAENV
jgi:hypothetical protein